MEDPFQVEFGRRRGNGKRNQDHGNKSREGLSPALQNACDYLRTTLGHFLSG